MANPTPTPTRPIPTPANLGICELNRRYTLITKNNVSSFFQYYDNIQVTSQPVNGNQGRTYEGMLNWVKNDYSREIISGNGSVSNREWFGEPLITSADEGLARTRYQRMDDYQDIYNRYIKPRIQEILKTSMAKLEQPQIRFNDRQLGIFDFNRASLGLIPVYKYYSVKQKKIVDGAEVETYEAGSVFKYRLISDGSPVISVPSLLTDDDKLRDKIYNEIYKGADVFETLAKYNVRIGGVDAFTSTYKKVWVLKEQVKKLKNAIRIFVKIGENSSCRFDDYKWNGYLGLALAEILDTLGYAVNIVGVYGNDHECNIEGNGNLEYGSRFFAINLKRFDETIDKGSILYFLSDMTFFRLKIFETIVKDAQYYNDYLDTMLGRSTNIYDIEKVVYKEFGGRDKMWNKKGEKENNCPFLYYIVGDIRNENELSSKILEITTDIINKNAEARQLFG